MVCSLDSVNVFMVSPTTLGEGTCYFSRYPDEEVEAERDGKIYPACFVFSFSPSFVNYLASALDWNIALSFS